MQSKLFVLGVWTNNNEFLPVAQVEMAMESVNPPFTKQFVAEVWPNDFATTGRKRVKQRATIEQALLVMASAPIQRVLAKKRRIDPIQRRSCSGYRQMASLQTTKLPAFRPLSLWGCLSGDPLSYVPTYEEHIAKVRMILEVWCVQPKDIIMGYCTPVYCKCLSLGFKLEFVQ
ncbi:hypothetical protein FQN55_001097 [Onygenales sp. PD_40]|nr:hypothetical protein FQN55_001097 [Onygenales sp. PD_40]